MEVAIAYALNTIRGGTNEVSVLDLRKAYDTVPGRKQLELLKLRINANFASQIANLFVPLEVSTKNQVSSRTVLAVAGVPKGEPTSPLIFNAYMDPLL